MSSSDYEKAGPAQNSDFAEHKPLLRDEQKQAIATPPLKPKSLHLLDQSSDCDSDESESDEQSRDRQMFEYFSHKHLMHYVHEISTCDGAEPSKV